MTGKWDEKRNKADSFHLVGIPPFVSYSLSPSRKVTAGSGDALVNIWDVGTGSLLYKLPGHQGSVNEAVFHPREKILGSCGTDGKIFLGEVDL